MVGLATAANRYMKDATDYVRREQAEAYRPLLRKADPILEPLGLTDACGIRGGVPKKQADELRALMHEAGLIKSHIWVKGFVATWIAARNAR